MLTGEESVDQLEQMAMQGGRGAFFFLRWVHGRRKYKKANQAAWEADNLMNDACSRYRGGYYNPANEKATEGMMSDLSGGKASTTEPFVFMGDRSDLSVFWQIVTPETKNRFRKSPEIRVSVPRSMIDGIPDETVRSKVISVFTKARADGLLQFDGMVYTLTDAGRRYILRSDFVLSRLNAEYDFFSRAHTQYESAAADQRAAEKELWIDAQLRERGIDDWQGRWPDSKRVSVDRVALDAQRVNDGWQIYVPGTRREMRISVPASDVIELNDKTLVAFLRPAGLYAEVLGKGEVSGKVLMTHFDDRTNRKTTRHPSAEAIQKAAAEPDITSNSSFNADEFFNAAVENSMRRHRKVANLPESKLRLGDTVYAPDQFSNRLDLHSYRVDRALGDSAGGVWYKLSGDNLPDQLLPEDALGKFLFTDEQEGMAYLSAHGKEAADYADVLLARTMGEVDTVETSIKTYSLTVDQTALISEQGEVCRIRIPGKQVEQLLVSAADVEKLNGKLRITLRSDQSYDVITGAYRYSASGDGIAKLSGAKEVGEPEREQALKEKKSLEQENKSVREKGRENLFGEDVSDPTADSVADAARAAGAVRNVERVAEAVGEEAKELPAGTERALAFNRADILSETSTAYRIRLPENSEQLEALLLPKSAVTEESDRLLAALDSKQEYSAFRFDGSYRVSRSGDDLMKMFGKPVETEAEALPPPSVNGEVAVIPSTDKMEALRFSVNRSDVVGENEWGIRFRAPQNDNGFNEYWIRKKYYLKDFTTVESLTAVGDKIDVAIPMEAKDCCDAVSYDGSPFITHLSPDQFAKELGTFAKVGQKSVGLTGAASSATNTAAVTVTATASGASAGAASATATAVAAIPIPEPITMTVKTICASAAQVSSVALQTGTKLVQSIGKEG